MSSPSVSIFISSFNQRELLEIALASVAEQTVPFDEIIVVDDASTDGSPELLKDFQAQGDNRHVILLDENVGLGEVRNIGFDRATSDYLAVLDGDDWLVPNAVTQIKDVLAHKRPDVLSFKTKNYSQDEGRFVDKHRKNLFYNDDAYSKGSLVTAKEREAIFRLVPATWSKVHRLGFIREHGMRYIFRVYEDLLWHYQCAVLSDEFLCVDLPMINYRIHGSSFLSRTTEEHFTMLDVIDACEEFMRNTPQAIDLREASNRYQFNLSANAVLNTPRIAQELKPKFAKEILQRPHLFEFEMDDRETDMLERVHALADIK